MSLNELDASFVAVVIKFTTDLNGFSPSIHKFSIAYTNLNGIICTLPLFLSISEICVKSNEFLPPKAGTVRVYDSRALKDTKSEETPMD